MASFWAMVARTKSGMESICCASLFTSVVGHSSFLYLVNSRRHHETWAPKMASFILRLLSTALAAFYVKFVMQWFLPLALCRHWKFSRT